MKREYRGMFSSSLCDMFSNSASSKTDACALACCGIWLWERNQFLLQGTYPKAWRQRPIETFIVVLLVASAIVWTLAPASMGLQICLMIIIALGIWRILEFEYSRSGFRHELAVEEYRRQSLANNMTVDQYSEDDSGGGGDGLGVEGETQQTTSSNNNNDTGSSRRVLSPQSSSSALFDSLDERQKQKGLQQYLSRNWDEINGPHNFFDFVRNDTVPTGEYEYYDDDEERDFCSCLWQCLASTFCNTCCMCWCLCCGMCAIAQEHRHLVKVLPDSPELWQRDYVTMQPWSDYFPRILQLRNTENMRFSAHFRALSQLSLRLVQAIGLFLVFAIVVTLLPVHYEKLQLAVVRFLPNYLPTYCYYSTVDLEESIQYFYSFISFITNIILVS